MASRKFAPYPSPTSPAASSSGSRLELDIKPDIHDDLTSIKQEPSSGVSPIFHQLSLTRSASPTPQRGSTHPPPPSFSRTRLAHRRTKSLHTHSRQLGFMLLPHPARSNRPSPTQSPSSMSQNSLSPASSRPTQSKFDHTERLMMVNPQIAAHLRQGGTVRVRSLDGGRWWRISLPNHDRTDRSYQLDPLNSMSVSLLSAKRVGGR